MSSSKVEVIYEVSTDNPNDWNLCFQWVRYHYNNNDPSETGYRFIWKRENGTYQPARGQARIPNASILFSLIHKAITAGWFITAERQL